MSEYSAVTTRSRLRKLEDEINRRRALEADSGVLSERAPASPSVAPTASSIRATAIPLTGGRVIDHTDASTPVRSGKRRSASHVSSKSGHRSAEHLRRRVEYEAERELVRLRENLVKKKLEADLAEIDAAEDEDSGSEDEGTTRRVEEWVAQATPVVQTCETETTRENPPPAPPREVLAPAASRDAIAPVFATPSVAPVSAPPLPPESVPALTQCAPATVQFREPAPRVTHIVPTQTPRDTYAEDQDRSRSRDRKIDQLADAITNLARPRPVPRQAYELPPFRGDPAEWLSYKNMYYDTTTMYQFKPHENLARLKTSLQGDAKIAVEDLLRTSTNPAEIMKTLDEEFGHPNLVLECALKKVRTLPKVTESGRELRKFSTTVRNCVSLLRSVKANGYLNNPQLVSELLNKLTPVQRAQYGDFAMGMATSQGIDVRVSPSLEILAEFLSQLARATSFYVQMDVSAPGAPVNTVKPRSAPMTRPQRNVQRVLVQAESERPAGGKEDDKCTLCEQEHSLLNCDKFKQMSVDKRWEHVKKNRLCFKCIVRKHNKNFCRANRCAKCNYAHHTVLHADKKTESVANVSDYTGKALLKMLPVRVNVNGVENECYALLDDGATVSLIDDSLADGATGERVPLVLRSARGQEVVDDTSRIVDVTVRGPSGQTHAVKCRTLRRLDLPAQTVPAAVMAEHAHLRDLGCEEMLGARPLLLLGQDNWELLVSLETRSGKSGKPVASLTSLGWVVHGPIGSRMCDHDNSVNCVVESTIDLHYLVKKQFELEAIGISEVPRAHKGVERANAILESTSRQLDSGAWEVGLLWRADEPQLPDNHKYARQRLAGIERRLCKDNAYAEAYTAQIDRLISESYASKVMGGVKSEPVWYLPHFGVSNPNKPGKLRLVFDAAASYKGTALNDNLLAGPDLLNSLLGVLFKFRLGPVAFTGDIADMFLRIKIREQDRGAQLFLWNPTGTGEPDVYRMNSMVFGAVSSPTSAIFILNKNANQHRETYPEAVSAIHKKHYMDDYLDSVWSVAQASSLIEQVTHVHAAGGFHIRGWVTNSRELRDKLRLDAPDRVSLDKGEGATERTLGMIWSPDTDRLAFDLSFKRLPKDITEGRVVPTKREFLRFIMSIFDPLGFLYPCVIQSRILMKRIWKSGIQWDERLRDPEADLWFHWLGNLQHLSEVSIPRWYGLVPENLELHVFGDASESAYAAVAYLAGVNSQGTRDVAMVIGKARVAPQKVVSVPRLELQAAVLACRLADTVESELGIAISQKCLWTDSKTVLKWINSDATEFQRFVSHRLAEIDKRSKRSDWRWVPSAMNPADKATRLDWPSNVSGEWLSGPSFLCCPQEQWPAGADLDAVSETELERVQRVHAVTAEEEPLLRHERLPTWTRALHVMARIIIFVDRCRRQRNTCAVTADDLRRAETRLLQMAQAESFGRDIAAMRAVRPLPKDSKLRPLDPILYEDGLLRVRGRLGACSALDFGERHPVILDGRHALTRLLVRGYHVAALHANQETVVNTVRERFWVTNLRSTVKAAVASCQRCRITRAAPVAPKMGDLPAARLEVTRRAFVHCGVDYFGPMEVSIGRRREKRWGVLFTCLTTRAVHIELAASLSADSAILALRRLIARRGRPADIYSDRGTNFVGAHAELRAALRDMDHARLESEATGRGIAWHFNPPASPHMGGCWERLVRSVKNALKVTLRERAPREEVLYTLLAEAELVINSRPLAYVSNDHEHPVVLTPNHLLLGTTAGDAPCTRRHDPDVDSRRLWRRANALADLFWRRWLREYLPTLQQRSKWHDNVPNVKLDDMVVIVDENRPRNQWIKGVIVKLYPGPDSAIRVVDVKTSTGVLRRPVVKIAVLPTNGDVIG